MKNFFHDGDKIEVVATGTVESGSGQQVGQLFGVAETAAANTETYVLCLKGIYDLPKDNTQAWTAWTTILYWDGTQLTPTATGNMRVGVAAETRLAAATRGRCRLNGVARPDEP